MVEKQLLESLFVKHGFSDYKWIKSEQIKVARWVRFKCLFGCAMYGKKGTCPPNTPSIDECREFFSEYEEAVIFHLQKAVEKIEDYHPWSRDTNRRLLEMERDVFLAGHHKAFLVSFEACNQCGECQANRLDCVNKKTARPGADALGIDVYQTARSVGYPIQVLRGINETMNRYAFLLIE